MEAEATIYVDILSEDDFISAAFDLVESAVGDKWMEGESFTVRNSKETTFLRRAFFEELFPTEQDALSAVQRYFLGKL